MYVTKEQIMKSAIKQIYEKQLGYRESEYDEKEYLKVKEEYCKAYEALEETLNEEQNKMLTELFDCEGDVAGALEFLSFKDGFCAGVRLGIELCEEEK